MRFKFFIFLLALPLLFACPTFQENERYTCDPGGYCPGSSICDTESGNCVECLEDEHCGAGRVCTGNRCLEDTCEPATCESTGVECSSFVDECGETINCGDCQDGWDCEEGKCVCVPDTCSSLGYVCGEHGDGCGVTLDCGDCSAHETCENGQCEQCPPTTCEVLGFDCGTHDDECGGTIACGTCATGFTCFAGVCVDASEVCHLEGFSVESTREVVFDDAAGLLSVTIADNSSTPNRSLFISWRLDELGERPGLGSHLIDQGANSTDCGLCVYIVEEGSPATRYFALSGSVEITELGPSGLTAELKDARFSEWDQATDQAVAEGETWCIESFVISSLVTNNPFCGSEDDCADTTVCLHNWCVDRCAGITCPTGRVCNPSTGRCADACSGVHHCRSNEICEGGYCKGTDGALCDVVDCASGYECVEHEHGDYCKWPCSDLDDCAHLGLTVTCASRNQVDFYCETNLCGTDELFGNSTVAAWNDPCPVTADLMGTCAGPLVAQVGVVGWIEIGLCFAHGSAALGAACSPDAGPGDEQACDGGVCVPDGDLHSCRERCTLLDSQECADLEGNPRTCTWLGRGRTGHCAPQSQNPSDTNATCEPSATELVCVEDHVCGDLNSDGEYSCVQFCDQLDHSCHSGICHQFDQDEHLLGLCY